jgi:hypothetical protein
MRCVVYFVLIFVMASIKGLSQDSIPYSKDFRLYEGLYLNYKEFRFNWPIPKEKIITNINKEQLDFYSKLVEEDSIKYQERDGKVSKIKSDKVWGYCQNNIIFINLNKSFYRIPVFGAISNFIGTVEVVNYSPGFDPYMNVPMNNTSSTTKEIRQFLFDFYSGDVLEFTTDNLEKLLKRDTLIYQEYMALSRKKRKEFSVKFIRQYNEKHMVYFPKG